MSCSTTLISLRVKIKAGSDGGVGDWRPDAGVGFGVCFVEVNGPRQAQTGGTLRGCFQTALVRPRLSAGCSGPPDGPANV
jgi:hypothetical protein